MRLSKELSHKTLWANLRQLWYTMHGLHDILHAMRSTPQIDLVCIRQFYPNILPNSAYLLTRCRSSLFNLTFFVIFLNSACIPSILMYFLLFHWFFLNLAQFTPILQFALILFNSAQFQFSLISFNIMNFYQFRSKYSTTRRQKGLHQGEKYQNKQTLFIPISPWIVLISSLERRWFSQCIWQRATTIRYLAWKSLPTRSWYSMSIAV